MRFPRGLTLSGRAGRGATPNRAEEFNEFLQDLRSGFARYIVQPFLMGVAGALGLSVGTERRRRAGRGSRARR